ncbi:MAG: PucR family transcriptional regulator [Acidimicrobiales bacterium]
MGSSEARAQESLADLLRQPAFQEVASLFRQFIAAAGNGRGAPGIARVLQQHTEKPVIVEDPGGRVIAASGAEQQWSRASDATRPRRPLPEEAEHAVAVFDLDRWVAVARPHGELLGAISLLESGEPATGVDLFELEQAATVLGWELLHSREIAEAEVALWGDFATELLEDSDTARVQSHADRLGYDLDQPHRAVLVLPAVPVSEDLWEAVGRATARLGIKFLSTPRPQGVVLIVAEELKWAELARAINSEREGEVRVGVGGLYPLKEVNRSLADAEFALTLTGSGLEKPVAVFDELGVWRLLARPDATDLQKLVDHWIGPLIDYDREHRSELLKTLIAYLNEFGALEATAAKLYVHRNSLRYRLARIAELTGWDLNDPEQRFHLDLACRAWLVRQAFDGPSLTTWPPDTEGNGVAKGSRLLARRPEAGPGAFAAKNTKSKPRRPGLA